MRKTCSARTGSRPWPAIVRLSAPPRIAAAAAIVARISACPMATGIGRGRHAHVGVDGRRQAVPGAAPGAARRCRAISRNSTALGSTTNVIAAPARSSACPAASVRPSTPGPTRIAGPVTLPGAAPLAAAMRQRRGRRRAEILAPGVRRDADAVADVPRQRARIEADAPSPPVPRSRRDRARSTPRPARPGRSRRAAAAGDRSAACQPWPPVSATRSVGRGLHDFHEAAEAGRGVRRFRVHEEHGAAARAGTRRGIDHALPVRPQRVEGGVASRTRQATCTRPARPPFCSICRATGDVASSGSSSCTAPSAT